MISSPVLVSTDHPGGRPPLTRDVMGIGGPRSSVMTVTNANETPGSGGSHSLHHSLSVPGNRIPQGNVPAILYSGRTFEVRPSPDD